MTSPIDLTPWDQAPPKRRPLVARVLHRAYRVWLYTIGTLWVIFSIAIGISIWLELARMQQ